jgi:hypothetical protein
MKLEFNQIVQYLPYELEVKTIVWQRNISEHITSKEMLCTYLIDNMDDYVEFLPILRPLSQIKEYFEPIFETDKDVNEYLSYEVTTPFSIDEILNYKFEYLPYGTCQVLLKHHFDLFGLIEKGLAVDINRLSVE